MGRWSNLFIVTLKEREGSRGGRGGRRPVNLHQEGSRRVRWVEGVARRERVRGKARNEGKVGGGGRGVRRNTSPHKGMSQRYHRDVINSIR